MAEGYQYATTDKRPDVLLHVERAAQAAALTVPDMHRALPRKNVQHPLAVYDALLTLDPSMYK